MGIAMMTLSLSSFRTASLSLSTSSNSFCLQTPLRSCWSLLSVESCSCWGWEEDEYVESTLGVEDEGDDIERRRTSGDVYGGKEKPNKGHSGSQGSECKV